MSLSVVIHYYCKELLKDDIPKCFDYRMLLKVKTVLLVVQWWRKRRRRQFMSCLCLSLLTEIQAYLVWLCFALLRSMDVVFLRNQSQDPSPAKWLWYSLHDGGLEPNLQNVRGMAVPKCESVSGPDFNTCNWNISSSCLLMDKELDENHQTTWTNPFSFFLNELF